MTKPRKLKEFDQEIDDKLDIDELSATKGGPYDIYAMSPDTAIPFCPECHLPMRNHGRYEREYLDYVYDDNGKPKFITLHFVFYKYRCLNEECPVTLFQKPVQFAKENANVTERLESLIVYYASCLSYSQTEERIKHTVSKQAIGQISKRWIDDKDEKRGSIFSTPRILGLVSFFMDSKGYIIAVDAGDRNLHIIEILKAVSTDEIRIFLGHLNKASISAVLTDCNPTIVSTVQDELPGVEVLVDTDALFQEAEDAFRNIIIHDAMHYMNSDKKLLLMDPQKLAESEYGTKTVRDITNRKPRVSNAYSHINNLRSILSSKWDVTDIRDWSYKIPIDCQKDFALASEYIDEYWNEFLAFYRRRREVSADLYDKLKRLDEMLQEFKKCSDELFRARILYTCLIGKEISIGDEKWKGVPYEWVIQTLDALLNEMED